MNAIVHQVVAILRPRLSNDSILNTTYTTYTFARHPAGQRWPPQPSRPRQRFSNKCLVSGKAGNFPVTRCPKLPATAQSNTVRTM